MSLIATFIQYKKYIIISIIIIIVGLGLGLGLGLNKSLFSSVKTDLTLCGANNLCTFPKCITGTGTLCPIKVACVGDSITYGDGNFNMGSERTQDGYTTQLGNMLGSKYSVCNYGCFSTTMNRKGTNSYAKGGPNNEGAFGFNSVLYGLPDIITIMLGTNDAGTYPSQYFPSQDFFEGETTWLITQFLSISSNPTIYICSPPPMYNIEKNEKNNNTLNTVIIPAIKNVVQQQKNKGNKVNYIDINSVFPNPNLDPDCTKIVPYIMTDYIHPNKNGCTMIATKIFETFLNNL